jgi:xylose isomerase
LAIERTANLLAAIGRRGNSAACAPCRHVYGYSANTVDRSLRQKRTFTIGVIVPEISEGYSTLLSGYKSNRIN